MGFWAVLKNAIARTMAKHKTHLNSTKNSILTTQPQHNNKKSSETISGEKEEKQGKAEMQCVCARTSMLCNEERGKI